MSTLPVAMTGAARFRCPTLRTIAECAWLLPRNLVIAFMLGYRAVISPIYGDVCRYYPSCSAYSVGALQQYGVIRGVLRTALRLGRCHPWAVGGEDDVPPNGAYRYELTRHGFVVPSSQGKG